MRVRPLAALAALAAALATPAAEPIGPAELDPVYLAALAESRREREARLASADGWLTVVGLHWLVPGENPFGADPANAIVLAVPGLPPRAGHFVLEAGDLALVAGTGAVVAVGGTPLEPGVRRALRDDSTGAPDVVSVGRLSLHTLRREERFAIRVKDPEAEARRSFAGLDYFPPSARLRVAARFAPFAEPRRLRFESGIGTVSEMVVPGVVHFEVDGRPHSLLPVAESAAPAEFWFLFKDRTSGKTSYGFRYLAAKVEGREVDLDFNRAYNPPCAFTAHATCPLPPRENTLDLEVDAGEKLYRHP